MIYWRGINIAIAIVRKIANVNNYMDASTYPQLKLKELEKEDAVA